ncbi:MAG: DMT family transporter [Micavibrio sp.]|nr:DMT family transporter [Micavibrio sp.]
MSQTQSKSYHAILICIAGFIGFSLSDALRKYLALSIDIPDILFWQAALGLVFLLIFSPLVGGVSSLYKAKNMKWLILRGLIMAANTYLAMNALAAIPLMDANTIWFMMPFVTSLFSAVLFGEKLGPKRLAAIAIGFLGGVIAFRPGFTELGPGYLFAFASMFTFTFSNLIAKKAGGGRNLLPYGVYPLSFVMLLSLYLNDWQIALDFPPLIWGIMFIVGAVYAMGLMLVSLAFQMGDASVIAPYQYTQGFWALFYGYIIFGDVPDIFKIIGASVIVGSGLFFFWRERKNRAVLTHPPASG